MLDITVEHVAPGKLEVDLLAFFVFEDAATYRWQMKEIGGLFGEKPLPFTKEQFGGKLQQTAIVTPHNAAARLLLLVGAGPVAKLTREGLRRLAAQAVKQAEVARASTVGMVIPEGPVAEAPALAAAGQLWNSAGQALGEGAALAAYRYEQYIAPDKRKKRAEKAILLVGRPGLRAHIGRGAKRALVLAAAVTTARNLANAPGNEVYPETLARAASRLGRVHGFRVTVLNEHRIRTLGMGGLAGVGQGSAHPPRFIIMEHNRAARRRGTVVLVGKGITFDSGGISIKPSAGMAEMKMDMSGAAAVIGTMQAAARFRLPLHLVGLVPAAENLPGGRALKPGDILRHYNGRTSEVDNTDAEGRLVLADALGYAARYSPDLVIDAATLTGAVVVALGHVATGMMGTANEQMLRLREAGERTYERVWELPLYDEYEKLIKSDVADVKNVGGRWAGAITGAMFLKQFIAEYPWIHLDIAGTAMQEEAGDYTPKGASGVGVRLLTDFLLTWRK